MNSDPWGLGYRVVMHKLGSQSTSPLMDGPRTDAILDALFSTHPVNVCEPHPVAEDTVLLFSEEEPKEGTG